MHNPNDVVALVSAAQRLIEQMKEQGLLTDHMLGHLYVANHNLFQLAFVHIAPEGFYCRAVDVIAKLRQRASSVRYVSSDRDISEGTTGSDDERMSGGAVATKELIVAWSSLDGIEASVDEAIAIMIAVMAGVLPRSAVENRFCDQTLPKHNPALRQLMDNISWTN